MSEIKKQMEADPAVYKALLESTRAIPWKIDWATKQFSYIGPQIEDMLGWSQVSWASLDEWAERMHPDDRDRVVEYCTAQSLDGIDHEADYRALCRDGSYVWIRDVVHVVREQGEVQALVGFMFDISERKRAEQEMENLRARLEAYSFCDGLTEVANRRMLDQTLSREWASAARLAQPMSVVLLDVDHFKEYNDSHGHLAGDECLKRIAGLLRRCATRPRDLIARYGGDEFVLVLPQTEATAAGKVAEKCSRLVRDAAMPHGSSPVGPNISVSIGLATITPTEGEGFGAFINSVDQAMYQAKERGRDCVVV